MDAAHRLWHSSTLSYKTTFDGRLQPVMSTHSPSTMPLPRGVWQSPKFRSARSTQKHLNETTCTAEHGWIEPTGMCTTYEYTDMHCMQYARLALRSLTLQTDSTGTLPCLPGKGIRMCLAE
eukprot:scaffold1085_cov407-Prasinococcus_capsulatus_cf.AAC.4